MKSRLYLGWRGVRLVVSLATGLSKGLRQTPPNLLEIGRLKVTFSSSPCCLIFHLLCFMLYLTLTFPGK